MRKKIFHNWGLKLASLMIAFVLWTLVSKWGDPLESMTYYNVPVVLKNTELLEKENKVYEVLDNTDTVRVTVRAPKSVKAQLRSTDIVAEADMSKLTDINTIAISFSIPSGNYESIVGDHDVVKLNVEDRVTKWIRIQYLTEGEVAEGYMIAGVSPDQNLIEVSGPKSSVEMISHAGVSVDVSGATNNMSMYVEPQLYNADGDALELTNITQNVKSVHMAVEVLATKTVPVEYAYSGEPGSGYLVSGPIQSTVEEVMIAGTTNALTAVNKVVIPAENLDITGETADKTFTLNVKDFLPENIRLANVSFSGRITVTVPIEQEEERALTLLKNHLSFVNMPAGIQAEAACLDGTITEEEAAEVCKCTVVGLRDDIFGLPGKGLSGSIDIAGWMNQNNIKELKPGAYVMPVNISLPENIRLKDEVTAKVFIMKTEDL